MSASNQSLAFIGGGNMAKSIIGGLIASGWPANRIHVSDPLEAQRISLSTEFGIQCYDDNLACGSQADAIVLAVKPQMFEQAAKSVAPILRNTDRLIISIAAGIEIRDALRWIGQDVPFVRVMPNTPALINQGISGLFANTITNPAQRNLANTIMAATGKTVWLDKESLIDSVTGISGSGPAYYFHLMEIMIEQAQQHGLDAQQATELVLQTALGAAMLASQSDHDPATLRKQVTSPNGTTQAALESMIANGLPQSVKAGVDAAVARSKSLSEELGDK